MEETRSGTRSGTMKATVGGLEDGQHKGRLGLNHKKEGRKTQRKENRCMQR